MKLADMNKTFLYLSLLSVLIIVLNGCAPVYRPPMANVPLFERDSEIQFGGYLTTNILEANIAKTITNDQAVTGALIVTTVNDTSSYYYGEMGYGFYKATEENGRMSAFGGLGYGAARASDENNGFNYNGFFTAEGEFIRPYLQGNIALSSKVIDFGFSARFAFVHFLRYAENRNNAGFEEIKVPGTFYLEPILFMNLGYDIIKMTAQVGLSIRSAPQVIYDYNPWIMGLGVVIQLPSDKKYEGR